MILTKKIQIVRTKEWGMKEWVKKMTQFKKRITKTIMTQRYKK